MNTDAAALLAAARRALQAAVRPELHSDHARSQLAGVLDILAKLERMTDWAPALLDDEACLLAQAEHALAQRAATHGLALPPSDEGVPLHPRQARHSRARQLSDWVFDTVPAGPAQRDLEALWRAGLHEAVRAERRHVPRTDFSAMTESKEG
jgi:hypothetical protein